ncbi:hypothetical protein DCAR_0309861 [Daucus carota subsp. sativus]|uniref:Uncharacterized protein n=1 Tax=Daucus carota subsp. sativus TaxID=79200 RepID=A0AAF1ARV0_DAUCS|nr:hypothetical protein DCAR_0309861 [Daucus carota subsp. sativus]
MTLTTEMNPKVQTEGEEEGAYMFAMQLVGASFLPMVLMSAIELDLLEAISKAGPGAYVSPSELADQLPSSQQGTPVMLDRILRFLASYSVLECRIRESTDGHIERLYGLAPVCKFFVKSSDGVSMAPYLLMNHDKIFMETWYHLKDAVLDGGIAFEKAHGMNVFEYNRKDPRFSQVFNQAMSSHSTLTMKKILQTYNGFEGLTTLVDVGGGTGATLSMIISSYPAIKGINFDLPNVVKDAPPYPGVEHVGGDMFVSVPRGDAIFMKYVCHNWSDERCLKLLKNCYQALTKKGKVIIVESISQEVPDSDIATKHVYDIDVAMLTRTPSGKERTENEFAALIKDAGFTGYSKASCGYNISVMELYK